MVFRFPLRSTDVPWNVSRNVGSYTWNYVWGGGGSVTSSRQIIQTGAASTLKEKDHGPALGSSLVLLLMRVAGDTMRYGD